MFEFSSAYRQLSQPERIFVDGYIGELERQAVYGNQRLDAVLGTVDTSQLDQRSLDMLHSGLVRAAITERVRDLSEDAELSVVKTLKEVRQIAYSNIGNYMDCDTYGVPNFNLEHCTPEQLAAIKSIKLTETPKGERKFEFVLHDKVQGLAMLMKYQGLVDQEHWRVETSKQSQQKVISSDDTVSDAADLYAKAING